ncbi:AlpA family phage regulatory protein [Halomonas daqingensis]|uniref:AlpA family phage regulatory protein n=1 Tax=Billgrantia desiderata TaxID=52021 RepID=A0AAW4YXJ0_9GAMM|nr:AlpA family phage regulatory protein [Halomonas desiderata]MCE8053179.1 AlpA family phage regulatory protein [Halomonas desiderata]
MSYDDDMVFLTTRDVIEKTGLSSTTMQRRRESDPTFPKPVVLSRVGNRPRCIRWVKSEVEAWMRQHAEHRLASQGEGHSMAANDIAIELGAGSIAEAAEETRYALVKQVQSIGTHIDTGYGTFQLTPDESAEIQSFIRRLLELRLVKLEGGSRHG